MVERDLDLGPQTLARVRAAADMVQVVGDHVQLRRRGRRWEGLCPFHDEKTPSFSIDPEKGLYYCFGCSKGGDIISFVMELEGLTFPDAVEQLARKFGVPLPPRRPGERRRRDEVDRITSLLDEAQGWFVSQLATPSAAAARRTLDARGFPAETWSTYGFGFAPDDWRRLLEHLSRRHTEGSVVTAGLAVDPGSGRPPYDRFRSRITFPIRARDGSLVAFGGRIVGDGEPKYLNSPESPLFEKRSTLFLLDQAWNTIGSSRTAVVVEGYFDCLQLHRVGITNAVATLGTSLTEQHARILKGRIRGEAPGERVLVCYDADPAGRRAAARAAAVLLESGVEEVGVVVLPPGQDPDDVIRAGGAELIRQLIERPTPLLEFLLSGLPEDPHQRRRHALAHAPLVCGTRNPATRRHLVNELGRLTDLAPREVEEMGSGALRARTAAAAPPSAPAPPVPAGERALVRILLEASPTWRERILTAVRPDLLRDQRLQRLVVEAASVDADGSPSPADFSRALLERCTDPETTLLIAELANSPLPELTDDSMERQLRLALREQSRELARRLRPAIEAAERSGDREELNRLLAEKARLRQGPGPPDGDPDAS
jgi:DNA primase